MNSKNTFRALCLAAAMGLVVTCALPQGRGKGDDKGGQSSGGSGKSGGSGDSRGGGSQGRGDGGRGNSGGDSRGSGGQSRGGDSRGSGGSPVVVGGGGQGRGNNSGDSRGSGGQGKGDPGKGDGGRGTGGTNGGGTTGGGTSGGQGRGDGGRGNNNNGDGRGTSGGGSTNGGQGRGGDGRGNNNNGDGRGSNGGGTSGGGSTGGSGQGGSGQGGIGRGRGGNNGGGTSGGGNSNGTGRGGDNDQVTRGGTGGTRGGTTNTVDTVGGIKIISSGTGRVDDRALGRKGSRSGSTNYGGSNNVATITRVGGAHVIGRAPDVRLVGKRDQILRKDNVRLNVGGFRVGYYHYDSRWCDDYFWYPHYRFDPWGTQCVVSPWYYYSSLPGYISWDRCRFYRMDPWNVWYGNPYQWQRPAYYGNYDVWGRGRGTEVDYAVDDIVNAFERADRRAAGRLIPERSEVAIYIDGNYSYTLNAEDFYDMFMDATQNTKTRRYEILKVETGRDSRDTARVTARHEYDDPWGQRISVTHYYELRYEGRNMVISKFGVSGDGRY